MTDYLPQEPPLASEPIVTVPPVSPVPPRKFPLVLALLIPVLVVAAVISIYVLLQARTMYQQAVATPAPTPQASADPTANWSYYVSEKYGFSFKYPQNMGNQGLVSGPYTLKSDLLSSFSIPETLREGTDAPFDGFSVYVVTENHMSNRDKYIDNELSAMKQSLNSTMANPQLKKLQIENSVAITSKGHAYYYLSSPTYDRTIVIAYIEANPSFQTVFDQILSTFKFEEIYQNKDLENTIKNVIYNGGKNPGIASKDEIIIKIQKIDGNFAYGIANFKDSMPGVYSSWYATYLDGHWTQIWAGQEPPTCVSLSDWQYPKDFFKCTQ